MRLATLVFLLFAAPCLADAPTTKPDTPEVTAMVSQMLKNGWKIKNAADGKVINDVAVNIVGFQKQNPDSKAAVPFIHHQSVGPEKMIGMTEAEANFVIDIIADMTGRPHRFAARTRTVIENRKFVEYTDVYSGQMRYTITFADGVVSAFLTITK